MNDYVLSLSYGKDSLACLGAIEQLGLPLTRIVHAEVWATDDIPADLPPMVEFKKKADKIIKDRWGIEVEHIYATRKCSQTVNVEREREREPKLTYERQFYTIRTRAIGGECIYGFPCVRGAWCPSKLKTDVLNATRKTNLRKDFLSDIPQGNTQGQNLRICDKATSVLHRRVETKTVADVSTKFSSCAAEQGADTNIVQYLGIAADEPKRIERHKDKPNIVLPLVEIGWDEAYCRKWCEENDLLSPIYTTSARGGCWFCHNQSIGQLRILRHDYPELWALLLKWDKDSPVTFKPDGHTVCDFDKRFELEDKGIISAEGKFRWEMLEDSPQLKFDF